MKKIYKGQPFKLILDTSKDLSTATTIQVRYKKPNDDTALYKTATISNISNQYIEANFTKDDNNVAGFWEFRSWIEFGANTGSVPGNIVSYYIEDI